MSTPSIGDLRLLWSSRDYSTNAASRAAISLLADGRPVTAEALAAATDMTGEEVRTFVESAQRCGAEIEEGAIIGLALSLRRTRHRFRVRGNDLYTWCGFDALFLPIMLGERAEVASACPVTGADIRLTVEPDGTVIDPVPAAAVVGIVGEEVTSCCTVAGPDSAICIQMPFFASREVAKLWVADHPGVAIVDLDQAREIARTYVLADRWRTDR
jgi:alkylmercury lyase